MPEVGQTESGVPFMYRAVQQGAPPPTGFRGVDAAMQLFAPPIARHLLGMEDPRYLPQIGGGVSAREGFYARDVTTPLYQASREQFNYQMGGAMGGVLGDMGNQLGVNNLANMSRSQFRDQMQNMGQTGAGRMIAEQLMSTTTAQSVLGGDPLQMQSDIFSMRNVLGSRPGDIIHPQDIRAQEEMAQRAGALTTNLTQAIYGNEAGELGVTPNFNFTRGMSPQDIGQMTQVMASRDAQGFRGADPSSQTAKIGQMNRVMEALSDVGGGNSVGELISNLDRLTQGDWGKVDPGRLEQTFREIGATSRILGVSSSQMLQSVQDVQQNIAAGMGISPEAQALGVSGGGYTQLPAAVQQAQLIQSIGSNQGVENDPMAMQQIAARQSALMNIGMQSSRGKDIQHIAYLAQTGQISEGMYEEFRQANAMGSTAQAQSVAERALGQAYGSAEEGRKMFNDPAIRRAIMEQTGPEAAQAAMQQIMVAQDREMTQRVSSGLLRRTGKLAGDIRGQAGIGDALSAGEQVGVKMRDLHDYFGAMEGPEGKVFQNEIQDTFERAQERALADGASPEVAKQRAMAQVEGLIADDPRFEVHRRDIAKKQSEAVAAAEVGRTMEMTPGLRASARMGAGMDYLRASGVNDDVENQMREISSKQAEAEIARSNGDTEKAEALDAEAKKMYGAIAGDPSLSESQKRGLKDREELSDRNMDKKAQLANANAAAAARMKRGEMLGGGVSEIGKENVGLLRILKGVEAGELDIGDAEDMVAGMGSLSTAEKDDLMEQLGSGDVSGALEGQRAVVNQMQQQVMRTSSDRGISDVFKGIDERMSSQEKMQYLLGDASGPGAVYGEAVREAQMGDKYQGLRRTLPQRVMDTLTGRSSVKSLLGMEDAGEVKTQHRVQEKLQQRADAIAAEERGALFDELQVGQDGGLFAADIDVGELSGKDQKIAKKALEALGEDVGGAFMGMGTSDRGLQKSLTKVASMDAGDIAKLSPEQQEAVKELGQLRKKQADKADKDSDDAKGGKGGKGMELSGTLVLYDKSGSKVGMVDDLRRK